MNVDEELYKRGWTIKMNGPNSIGSCTYIKNGKEFHDALMALNSEGVDVAYTEGGGTAWKSPPSIERCLNCGSEKYSTCVRASVILEGYDEPVLATVQCGACATVKRDYPRDAFGQRVALPTSWEPKFSYATGTPITSSRQYAEVLKRMNLVQKEA